jgi:phosphomannomutase
MKGMYDAFFKAYDVRGKIPDVDERLFYLIGKGLVETVLKPENLPLTVNVTYDVREKSELFSRYLNKGIIDAGGDVVYLGLASTEFLYTACVVNGNPGVQLTASHNPREYHGLKIVKQAPIMVGLKTGLSDIRDYVNDHIDDEIPDLTKLVGVDQSTRQLVTEEYIKKIKEVGSIGSINAQMKLDSKKIKIVVDCSNGCAATYMPQIEEMYNHIEFIKLYWEADGTFPNHPADVMEVENLKDLKKAIVDNNADFGAIFDGDADRLTLLDEHGERIEGDFLVSAFAQSLLQEYKSNPQWHDLYNPVIASIQPNSRCVWDTIGENDGVGVICKQGHTFVKDAMAQYNGLYGGEYSNHHYFAQIKGMDSGAMPLVLFIKMYIEGDHTSAKNMFTNWSKRYYITELMNLEIPKGKTFEEWKEILKKEYSDGVQSEFDGYAVYFPDWKFSMRASNTEPVVRFILETRGKDHRKEKVQEIYKLLNM